MKKLSFIDLAFLVVETDDSPKHVAGLMILEPPADAAPGYARRLFDELRTHRRPREPFNQVVNFLGLGGPRWRPVEGFNLDDHLFLHEPDQPLDRSALYALVAELHTPQLDRSRPLWEYHIIDGLEDGRFAVYSKIHHAYADGVTLTRWTAEALEERPKVEGFKPIWRMSFGRRRRRERKSSAFTMLKGILKGSWNQVRITGGLAKLGVQLALEQLGLTKNAVSLPFRTFERTPLTGQVHAPRQFAKASVPMAQIKRIRQMCRASLNHVALTCIDGALRQYLRDTGNDVHRPVAIQMPVSLRAKGDTGGGNKIAIITVDLASNTNDPYERLREIGFTLRNVRNQIDSVPAASVQQYSIILGVAAQLTELLRINDVVPSIADTVVSNVPGPPQHLYLRDARVEEMCPVSTLIAGSHLNITLFSYAGTLHFGLVAGQELGDLERLADYIGQAFQDLENAVFHPPKRSSKGKAKASKESADKAATDKPTTEKASSKKIPPNKAPLKAAPPKKAPAKVAPAKAAPAKVAPAKVAPAKAAPAKAAPAKAAPAKKAPPKKAPPKKAAPKKAAPKKAAPKKAAPKKAAPKTAAPKKAAPKKAAPKKAAPKKAPPKKAAPKKAAPEKAAPKKAPPKKGTAAADQPSSGR